VETSIGACQVASVRLREPEHAAAWSLTGVSMQVPDFVQPCHCFFFHGRNVTRDNTPPAQGAVHQNTGKYNPDMGHVRKVPEYEA